MFGQAKEVPAALLSVLPPEKLCQTFSQPSGLAALSYKEEGVLSDQCAILIKIKWSSC